MRLLGQPTAEMVEQFRHAVRRIDAHRKAEEEYRSRTFRRKWRRIGERCNKHLSRMAKAKSEPARIAESDGAVKEDSPGMLQVVERHFSEQFPDEPTDALGTDL